MQDVITLTMNPSVDKSSAVDSVASEIKLRCDPPHFDPGGGGINVSRAIKKLGGTSLAVYPSGGVTGQLLADLLDAEAIDQHHLEMAGMVRQSLTVFEKSTELQYRFGMPGPELSEAEWQNCLDTVIDMAQDWIVASGSLPRGVPQDFYAQLVTRAREKNIRTVVDTYGDALHEAVKAGVYLIKPNLRELSLFHGEKIRDDDDLLEVCRELISAGKAEVLIVSTGKSGATLVTAEMHAQLRPPLVPIQSKVGAGDSMVGGIVYALENEMSLLEAARYGVAAGSAAVMTPGTQLCRKEDTERIYKQIAITQHAG